MSVIPQTPPIVIGGAWTMRCVILQYLDTLSEIKLYALYAPVTLVSSAILLFGIYRISKQREGYRHFATLEFIISRLLGMFAAGALFLPMFLSLLGSPLLKTMKTTFISLNLILIAAFMYQLAWAKAGKKAANSQLEEKISTAWKIAKSNPDNAAAYFRLGELYEQSDRMADAIACYKKSYLLDPTMSTKYTLDMAIKRKMPEK